MIREDCLYYEKCKDMGATIDWCKNYPHLNFDCEKCERYIEKNFVQVVRCKDCEFYDENEKWCRRLGLIGAFNENDFCSHGERKKDAVDE